MTAHMDTLHGRIDRFSLAGGSMGLVTDVVGTHHLGNARIYLSHVDNVGLVRRDGVHQARFVRVGLLQGRIARGRIAQLVGRSRKHLLVYL